MLEIIFLIALASVWLVFASINDLRERIVPNWLNFSLIIFAFGARFFYSLFADDYSFLVQGILGFGIFFAVGNTLYYGRMFAGGDAKLMIALGAILSFSENFMTNLGIFASFLFVFMISSVVYGAGWAAILPLKNWKNFKKELSEQIKKNRMKINLIMAFGVLISLFGFMAAPFFYLGAIFFLTAYLYPYAKTVDDFCLAKSIDTGKLTEGDWLYRDVKSGKRTIKAKWDGLGKSEIDFLKKNFRSVKIKQGIPFVPVFLISFAILVYFYFNGINLLSWI